MTKEYQLTHLRALYLPGPENEDGRCTKPINFRNGKFRTQDEEQQEYLDNLKSNGVVFEEIEAVEIEEAEETEGIVQIEQELTEEELEDVEALEEDEEIVDESVTNFQEAKNVIKAYDPEFVGRSEQSVRDAALEMNITFPNWD